MGQINWGSQKTIISKGIYICCGRSIAQAGNECKSNLPRVRREPQQHPKYFSQ